MYDSTHKTPTGDFQAKAISRGAVLKFVECPKFLTIVRHADLDEVTPIHCRVAGSGKEVDFLVPQQKLDMQFTPEGIRYSAVLVIKNETPHYLFVCEWNRMGFLVPVRKINTQRLKKTGKFSLRKRRVSIL